MTAEQTGIAGLPGEAWERVAATPIFLGHRSVGANILEGVREVLDEHPAIAAELYRPGAITGWLIGRNGDPLGKTRAFFSRVAQETAGLPAAVALHKYCYLDMRPGTDPDSLFAAYRTEVEAFRAAHPNVTIAHITMPLTTDEGWVRRTAKGVLGRTTGRDLNRARHRFNTRLLEVYQGLDPVFDLATLESTGPDRRPSGFTTAGEWVPVLNPAWTDDGGHLNRSGRRQVGEQFLVFLAQVADRVPSEAAPPGGAAAVGGAEP